MSNVVDLGVLVKEPLIFKNCPDGRDYTIPGEISTKFVIKLSHYQQEIQNLNDNEEAIKKMKQIVVDILNLDKEKNVDLNYINEHFDNIHVLKTIVEQMMLHIQKIANDPNSNSLQSQ